MKNRIITFILVILMFLMQVPFSAFAEETTTGTLNPATLSNGKVGHSYSMTFGFESETYTSCDWSIDGSLPAGLELSSYTSTKNPKISGVPETAGSYTFKMQAKCDVSGETKVVFEKEYTWVIEPADPLRITGESKWYGYEVSSGSPYAFNHTCEINLKFDATWSMEAVDGETLPEGLTFDNETGKIYWAEPKVGKYQMKVTATCKGETVSKTLKLIVVPYDGCEHTGLTKTTGTAATCKANGMPDYWYCDACEGYYYDADCKRTASEKAAELYTIGFHEDTNNDNKCDTCGKTMPIFKKVTTNDEITSYGMYLVVAKIGDDYYTLKTPKEYYTESIEAVKITQNADGTFSYPKSNEGVMILQTSAAMAAGGELDAGSPRYGFSTTINGVPYGLMYEYGLYTYAYEDTSKYGFRIKLTDEKYAEIADVYSEYWGDGGSGKSEKGKGGDSSCLSAYAGTVDGATKQYFSFEASDDTKYPVALYKLAYVNETEDGQSYTVSDAPLTVSQAAVTNTLTNTGSAENNQFSAVNGIGDALKEDAVGKIIADVVEEKGLTDTTAFTVQAYAEIEAKSEETAPADDGGTVEVTEITYEVTPYIAINKTDGTTVATQAVSDTALNGTKMTVTLCVGTMEPAQIIHYKNDNTEEYFYAEDSEKVKNGAKSFKLTKDENGNLVTFEINSFSEIKILATAADEKTKYNVTLTGAGTGATGVGKYTEGATVEIYAGTKSGCSFGGWTTDDVTLTDAENANTSFTMPGKKVTVTANWNSTTTGGGGGTTTYTVKFETNGGNAIDSVKIAKNKTVAVPTAPTKDGFEFAGWYTDKELTTAYDFDAKVTKGMTLYAAWTEKKTEVKDDVTEPIEPTEPTTPGNKIAFSDVNENDWFADNVQYVTENGLMNGTTATEFTPNDNLTRAMLVTILYRAEGEPAVNKSIPFADVKADSYYANAVIWAQQNGIVSGVNENEFAPDENITREQIATIIYRYANYKGYDVSVGEDTNILSYADANEISEYAVSAVQYAVGSGLMKGKTESTLNPQDNATRAEIAAILQRFIEANK